MSAETEKTDREIHEAWLRYFRKKLAEDKEPDRPVIGCSCHMMSIRELVGNLERVVIGGETIDLEKHHWMRSYIETGTIRKVARMNRQDPVAMIDTSG